MFVNAKKVFFGFYKCAVIENTYLLPSEYLVTLVKGERENRKVTKKALKDLKALP